MKFFNKLLTCKSKCAERISLLTLKDPYSAFSIMWLSCLPWNAALYLRNTLLFPVTALPCIPMPAHAVITGMVRQKTCAIFQTLMLPGAGTATWTNITSAILCSSYPAITVNSGQIFLCSCVLPAQDGMIRSAFLLLSMNCKNI